jgi:hypothetical protein
MILGPQSMSVWRNLTTAVLPLLLGDGVIGGASNSGSVQTLRTISESKKKGLESLHLSYSFLVREEVCFLLHSLRWDKAG